VHWLANTGRTHSDRERISTKVDRNGDTGDAIIHSLETVQVKAASEHDKCMSYAGEDSFVKMETCSTTGSANDDHWEKIEVSDGLFALRHKKTQKCIPQNPESTYSSFDCFASSGKDEAVADRISWLVDCSSPYAATMGFLDSFSSMYLYHKQCASGNSPGADTDIILMTYVDNGSIVVVWGEKILLDLEGVVSNRGLTGNWYLANVQ
jgi:hypothetical protein